MQQVIVTPPLRFLCVGNLLENNGAAAETSLIGEKNQPRKQYIGRNFEHMTEVFFQTILLVVSVIT